MIGLVLAAPIVARLIAVPLVARAADRRDALRAAIIVASWLSVAGFVLVGLADGRVAILATYALAALALTPVMPLAETYALKGLAARGRAYGPVRLWGSVAFILGIFLAGFATDTFPARHLIWLIVAASLVERAGRLRRWRRLQPPRRPRRRAASAAQVAAARSRFHGRGGGGEPDPGEPRGLLRLLGAGMARAGLDGTTIAALWGLGVIAEIVLFALSGRLPPFFQPSVLLMIGARRRGAALGGDGARSAGVRRCRCCNCCTRLSFGATHLGALGFLARHAPAGQGATAQGYLAVAIGAAMAARWDCRVCSMAHSARSAYAAMALAAIAGGVCGGVAHRTRRRSGAVSADARNACARAAASRSQLATMPCSSRPCR